MAIQKKGSSHKVDCYLKWLRLKESQEYQEASQEIRQLQERVREADERYSAAHDAYVPLLPYPNPNLPDSKEKQRIQKEYWTAEESARMAQKALTKIVDEMCRKFGLFQWWDPDEHPITIEDASCLFDDDSAVEVLDPSPERRRDWRAEIRRAMDRDGKWREPPSWNTKVDKAGCLTLRVNLNVPIDRSERIIGKLLRFYRDKPKTRNRPDTRLKGIEVLLAWKKNHDLGAVAQTLQLPLTTTRRLFRETFRQVFEKRPPQKQKARKAADFVDFPSHVPDCARCQKGEKTGDWQDFCDIAKAAIDQDSNWGLILSGQL